MKSIKILVAYHKPALLAKNHIFVPIHVGRALATEALKDNKISKEFYQWMLDNMFGDDTGDNISSLNQYFAELTAIYWAWKNYDKLGNPDYIGLSHYRRIFRKEDIESATDYDITATRENFLISMGDQFYNYHRTYDLIKAVDLLNSKYDEYKDVSQTYLNQKYGYFYNMFIMKKEIFFEYCEKLFSVLFQLHKSIDYNKLEEYNKRMPAFVAERLTGIFITEKKKNCKVRDVKVQNIYINF